MKNSTENATERLPLYVRRQESQEQETVLLIKIKAAPIFVGFLRKKTGPPNVSTAQKKRRSENSPLNSINDATGTPANASRPFKSTSPTNLRQAAPVPPVASERVVETRNAKSVRFADVPTAQRLKFPALSVSTPIVARRSNVYFFRSGGVDAGPFRSPAGSFFS